MKRSPVSVATCAAIVCAGLMAGCALQGYGTASPYERDMLSTTNVVMPANAPSIFQQFRVRRSSIRNPSFDADHEGIDIGAVSGTPVLAAAPGRVVASFVEPMYGNQLIVEHESAGRPTRTVYRHLNRRLASTGQTVARGQQIGTLGLTGILAGGIPHLHFEVRRRIGSKGFTPFDPHLFWVKGEGRVTCYETGLATEGESFRMTYPVACKPSAVVRDANGERTTPPTGAWVDDLFDAAPASQAGNTPAN